MHARAIVAQGRSLVAGLFGGSQSMAPSVDQGLVRPGQTAVAASPGETAAAETPQLDSDLSHRVGTIGSVVQTVRAHHGHLVPRGAAGPSHYRQIIHRAVVASCPQTCPAQRRARLTMTALLQCLVRERRPRKKKSQVERPLRCRRQSQSAPKVARP